MKSKKLFLPAIIIVIAILAIAAYSVVVSIAKKPTVTEGEFPFSITYELDGETVTINDVYRVRYIGNYGYADTKERIYLGKIGNLEESDTIYTIKKDKNTSIELRTYFYPDYLMGDCESDYFDDKPFEPRIYYYDAEGQGYSDEETLKSKGVKLISFEYPTPIKNSLVFSHISYFSGEIVLPIVAIALFALGAIIIFVKKEKELIYQTIDIISIVFNFVIGCTLLPYVTIVGILIDINGGGPELYRQIMYFIPSFIVLCLGASVAFRRAGYGVKALVSELLGPAFFIVFLIVCGVCGLL